MGTCTIIATGTDGTPNYVDCFVSIREAMDFADRLKAERWENTRTPLYSSVRVYSESPDGRTLTLIYVPA